jgi:cytidylate kinase
MKNLPNIIVAIDGYSACGKSTTAKEAARILGYRYIDSGAMYRAVTLNFLENHVSFNNPKEVSQALKQIDISFKVDTKKETSIYLNGLKVDSKIRKMKISDQVSTVSAIKEVRNAMVALQRKLGKDRGIIMDGRDIGTVVFPDAHLKIFMTADITTRAIRRQKELLKADQLVNLDDVIANITKRDQIDTSRKESPLRKAKNAITIDTTQMLIDEQVDQVVRLALGKILGLSE